MVTKNMGPTCIEEYITVVYLILFTLQRQLYPYYNLTFYPNTKVVTLQKMRPISTFYICRGNAAFRRFEKRLDEGQNAGMRK